METERTITLERTRAFRHWLEKEQVNDATVVKDGLAVERFGAYLHGTAALLGYAEREGIQEGMVFRTRSGNRVNRSNVWKNIKKLCAETGVDEGRVSLVKFKMPRMHDYYPFYGIRETSEK